VGVHPGGPSAVGDGSHQPPARPQPGWTTSSDSTTSGGRSPIEDCDLARQEGVTSGEREETTVTLDSLPNQKIGSNAVRGWEPRSGQIDALARSAKVSGEFGHSKDHGG
jgi:hypothetical protein